MSYTIFWSKTAEIDYIKNIDFLLETWYEKQALDFIDAVNKHLNLISNNPKIFALTDYYNVRSVLIVKQIRLFYRILDDNSVELIRFWNNYQNPNKLKF
ncbi:MAG: type II toxin-antitoxin system RelE/ParE family toxin [Chlorobi bacterium]|nr:type II toxin-antitoxin system RelE/ParE family toxin [Chlorobiota bacterium]